MCNVYRYARNLSGSDVQISYSHNVRITQNQGLPMAFSPYESSVSMKRVVVEVFLFEFQV